MTACFPRIFEHDDEEGRTQYVAFCGYCDLLCHTGFYGMKADALSAFLKAQAECADEEASR